MNKINNYCQITGGYCSKFINTKQCINVCKYVDGELLDVLPCGYGNGNPVPVVDGNEIKPSCGYNRETCPYGGCNLTVGEYIAWDGKCPYK